jgi:hypothetical protein
MIILIYFLCEMIDPKPDNDGCQYKGLLTRAQVQMHELCAVKYKSFAKKKDA